MSAKAGGASREVKRDDVFGRHARSLASFSRKIAIERATAELARLKPRITAHIKEECRHVEAALLAAQARDESYRTHVAEAYRASLNLRDVAQSMDYSLVGFVAANFCLIVETADAAQTDYPAAILDCYLDAFRLAQTRPYKTKQPEELPAFSAGLLQTVQWMKAKAERGATSHGAP
jgi:hypothetical protein